MYASSYLENKVICADPIGLVKLLYEGAVDSLLQARSFLEEGKIRERSSALSKAMQIVLELQGALDLERGGEIAERLAQLYAYIQERLVEANARQEPAPIEEAVKLLNILYAGWQQVSTEAVLPPSEPQHAAVLGWTV